MISKPLSALLFTILLVYITSLSHAQRQKAPVFEVPPTPFTTRMSPENGSISHSNPTTFLWMPVNGYSNYVLQYSKDSLFLPASTQTNLCKETIYVPTTRLDSGQWFWRYGVTSKETKELIFSKTMSFSIAKEATVLPFPDVNLAISQLKGKRPRIFVQPNDLVKFRDLAKGPLKAEVEEMRQACDTLFNGPMLSEPPFLAGEEQEKLRLFVKIMHETRRFNGSMVNCASLYLLTGEEKYGQEAYRRLMHLTTWNPEGSTNVFHNDEPGSEIVKAMARTYDRIFPLLSEQDKISIRKTLFVRTKQLHEALRRLPFEIRPYNSHAMGYFLGDLIEASICLAGEPVPNGMEDIKLDEVFRYALLQLWSPFFPPYGGSDGGWNEGPTYWQWSTNVFLSTFLLVSQNTGTDLLTAKSWLRNTPYYKLYGNPPYSKMSPFGDYQENKVANPDVMYKLGIKLNNPYALWYANQVPNSLPKGLDRFLYYVDGDDKGTPPSDLSQAKVFYDMGLAAMHTALDKKEDNVQVLLKSSPFGSISHSYPDQNTFALFAYGEPLIIPSGYYPYYGSIHHKEWNWQTKASNSILVNNEGQGVSDWDAKGKITAFKTTDYAHYATADATQAYKGRVSKFLRHVLFIRPSDQYNKPIIVLLDELQAEKPSSFTFLLHSINEMLPDQKKQSVEIKQGNARVKTYFLNDEDLQFSQHDQFSAPPEGKNQVNQWHFSGVTTTNRTDKQLATVMLPFRAAEEVDLPKVKRRNLKNGFSIEVRSSRSKTEIVFIKKDGIKKALSDRSNFSMTSKTYDHKGKLVSQFIVE